MACVNADGSLTPIAKKVLSAMLEPRNAVEISNITGVPLYRVRSSLRELTQLTAILVIGDRYQISDNGRQLLKKQN